MRLLHIRPCARLDAQWRSLLTSVAQTQGPGNLARAAKLPARTLTQDSAIPYGIMGPKPFCHGRALLDCSAAAALLPLKRIVPEGGAPHLSPR
jgi:hypothetical protein